MSTDDLRAVLDDWKALEAAATPGPWFADGSCLMHDVPHVDLDYDYRVSLLNGTDGVSVPGWCESAADAEFIAASRTLVPRLIAALEAVLEEHPATQRGQRFTCATCAVTHPCLTVTALRAALLGDQPVSQGFTTGPNEAMIGPEVTLEWSPYDDLPPCIDFTCPCGFWQHLCEGPNWIPEGHGQGQVPGVECVCGAAWPLNRVRTGKPLHPKGSLT